MKVCLFGTYNYHYSRNSSIRDGLKKLAVDVVEVHQEVQKSRLETPKDFSLLKAASRVGRKLLTSFWLLTQYSQVAECDAIIVLYPGHLDLPIAWAIAKLSGKPLIFDSFISLYDNMIIDKKVAAENAIRTKVLKYFEKLLLHLPDKLFTDTELMKNFIIKEFNINPEKIFVVPLGANDAVYKPAPLTLDGGTQMKNTNKGDSSEVDKQQTKVFFFGLYNPLQGAPYIIRAIKRLQNDKSIAFTMLGDGPLRQEILDYAKKHQLKNVKFIGFVPEKDLVKQIQNADIMLGIFSNSSIARRVIPNKVFAALACRKPLITARSPAAEKFFTHRKHTYYCNPEDPKSLAESIKAVAIEPKLQKKLAENGYAEYKKRFTPEQIAKALINGIKQ